MTVDPLILVPELRRATDRLLTTAASLSEADVAGPSLLPGWTRGHVLAHVARNADAYVNLLTAARTGEPIPAYASAAARDADIEAGSGRPPAAQLADLRSSAARFAEAVAAMPAEAWAATVQGRHGPRVAATLVWARLREVEVHHVDLAAGYTTADWSDAFGHRLLHEVASDLAARPDTPALAVRPAGNGHELRLGAAETPDAGAGDTAVRTTPVVSGPVDELAGWLIGRSAGTTLTVTPEGPLPAPPPWM